MTSDASEQQDMSPLDKFATGHFFLGLFCGRSILREYVVFVLVLVILAFTLAELGLH